MARRWEAGRLTPTATAATCRLPSPVSTGLAARFRHLSLLFVTTSPRGWCHSLHFTEGD